jgi:hypothetical protein
LRVKTNSDRKTQTVVYCGLFGVIKEQLQHRYTIAEQNIHHTADPRGGYTLKIKGALTLHQSSL